MKSLTVLLLVFAMVAINTYFYLKVKVLQESLTNSQIQTEELLQKEK